MNPDLFTPEELQKLKESYWLKAMREEINEKTEWDEAGWCTKKAANQKKKQLREAGMLVEEKCFYCRYETGTPIFEVLEQAKLRYKYEHDLRLTGFHCEKPGHIKFVHAVIGKPRWSCCEAH